jgi:ATP-dependent Clp endopeptidase proteolytic subunit ClpP
MAIEQLDIAKLKYLFEHSLDVDNRRLYLFEDIDGASADMLISHIHWLNSKNDEMIQIIINSPGGYDEAMFSIYDAIVASRAEVVTIATGCVSSAATLVLFCGDRRYATENCWLMTHKGNAEVEGDEDSLVSQTELFLAMSDRYWKLLERHSNRSALQWFRKSKKEGEAYMNAETMLQWGAIDAILKPERREFSPVPTRRLQALIKELEAEDEDE